MQRYILILDKPAFFMINVIYIYSWIFTIVILFRYVWCGSYWLMHLYDSTKNMIWRAQCTSLGLNCCWDWQ